jgi:hypothetical protein
MAHKRIRRPTVPALFAQLGIRPPRPGTIKGQRADNLPVGEEQHFYVCKACDQAVDMRDLGQVFHHEVPGHKKLPEN